jgi:hypothetical protein
MQAHIHQALTLTIFGNEFLRGLSHPAFWPDSVAFQFYRAVVFVDGPPRTTKDNTELAVDPVSWLALLASSNVRAIEVHNAPGKSVAEDYNTAVFGGGGRWLIETTTGAKSDLWQSRSEVVDKNAPDRRIWSGTYYRIAENWEPVPNATSDVARARSDLESILSRAIPFALRHPEKSDFANNFQRGLDALSSPTPLEPGKTSDFAECPSLSMAAKQLLGAAGAAWVFGGMSWWNDGGVFDKNADEEYLAISADLWRALVQSVLAAANSTVDPALTG